MLTVSEVKKTGKAIFEITEITGSWLALGFLFLFSLPAQGADSVDRLGKELGDCNWQVTYRGRQYDLSPLTREALSRPIENDIRFAIQRVPEANARLESMTSLLRNARAHTLLATAFLGAFALLKVLESNQDNQDKRRDLQVGSYASAGFFLGATYFSWKSTSDAKQELVRAVEEFNAHSPHDILPASGGINLPANQGLETVR